MAHGCDNAHMAQASQPPRVKMICGMIAANAGLLDEAAAELAQLLGRVDFASDTMTFDRTHYYSDQMGSTLLRRLVSFEPLHRADELPGVKVATNAIEQQFAQRHRFVMRPINLDPGYLEPSKLVLASMKNFSHRIYLGQGVFGEVTLLFHKEGWETLGWTFPDYARGEYFPFLTAVRTRLRNQLEQEGLRPC